MLHRDSKVSNRLGRKGNTTVYIVGKVDRQRIDNFQRKRTRSTVTAKILDVHDCGSTSESQDKVQVDTGKGILSASQASHFIATCNGIDGVGQTPRAKELGVLENTLVATGNVQCVDSRLRCRQVGKKYSTNSQSNIFSGDFLLVILYTVGQKLGRFHDRGNVDELASWYIACGTCVQFIVNQFQISHGCPIVTWSENFKQGIVCEAVNGTGPECKVKGLALADGQTRWNPVAKPISKRVLLQIQCQIGGDKGDSPRNRTNSLNFQIVITPNHTGITGNGETRWVEGGNHVCTKRIIGTQDQTTSVRICEGNVLTL